MTGEIQLTNALLPISTLWKRLRICFYINCTSVCLWTMPDVTVARYVNHCHCPQKIHVTYHKPNSHTKFTAVPTLSAPQVYQEVHRSYPGRDKVYTDWMFCASRLSLQPHATLEIFPRLRKLRSCRLPPAYCPGWLHQVHTISFMFANTFLEPPAISACVSQQSPLRLLTAMLPPNVLGI